MWLWKWKKEHCVSYHLHEPSSHSRGKTSCPDEPPSGNTASVTGCLSNGETVRMSYLKHLCSNTRSPMLCKILTLLLLLVPLFTHRVVHPSYLNQPFMMSQRVPKLMPSYWKHPMVGVNFIPLRARCFVPFKYVDTSKNFSFSFSRR